jgi:tetratricopeptide (TPR) repeat protein
MPEKYGDLDKYWQHFNRVYIVVYPPEREGELSAILGPDADSTANVQRALDKARSEAQGNPTNPYAWFNMGTNYVLLGQYQNAAKAYDVARNAGDGLPYRMLWYQFGPFAAYYKSGDYDTTLKLIAATFGTTSNVEELWYWRGMVRAAQGDHQQAMKDFDSAVRYNPNYQPAVDALAKVQSGAAPQVPQMP